MNKTKVLFLCTGNSARSQMAEALLRKHANDRFEVYSAGLEPKGVNPYTTKVLEEIGVDPSPLYSKPLTTFMGNVHFGYLITVCGHAEKNCPIFPGMGKRIHWPLEDPAAFQGSQAETLEKFREIRDQIDQYIKEWLEN
jgi:arsenate reductase